jgi:Leucine-rich repeat (LRR) protein
LTNLSISNCPELKKVDCTFNKLKELDLSGCKNLQSLKADSNSLSDIAFLNELSDREELKELTLGLNNSEDGLEVFSHFTNLEYLELGTYGELAEKEKEKLNRLKGSLSFLQRLEKLKKLDISNTDLESDDLSWLPPNIEDIYCSSNERKNSKVKKIEELLKKSENFSFDGEKGKYTRVDAQY